MISFQIRKSRIHTKKYWYFIMIRKETEQWAGLTGKILGLHRFVQNWFVKLFHQLLAVCLFVRLCDFWRLLYTNEVSEVWEVLN